MSEPNEQSRVEPRAAAAPPPLPSAQNPGGATAAAAQNLAALPSLSGDDATRARIAALEREAKAWGNDPEAAPLHHELGLLWEELHNPRNAALAFLAAQRLDPSFIANLRAARRLFLDVGNWQMVIQLLDAELEASASDDRLKASLLFEKAVILEERLGRPEDATRAYEEVLAFQPRDLTLLVQLASVFSVREDFASLVEVYRALAAQVESSALRAHYLTLAGIVLDERLNSTEMAAQCFRQALALDPRNLVLLAAVRLTAEREGQTEELTQALSAESTLLGKEGIPAYLQLASIHQQLGRPAEALTSLLAARNADPKEPLVLAALATLYEGMGRHEELANVLLSWAQVTTDPSERVQLKLRLAALYDETLKRDSEAAAEYKAVLALAPGHAGALAALGKLYFRIQDWEGSLGVFEKELEATDDPKQRALKHYKVGEVLEERLRRDDDAIQRYHDALRAHPGYVPAQKALVRIYERQHRYGELTALYEHELQGTQDRDQLIATLNRIAQVHEERLSDLDRAADAYQRILDIASDHLPTLRNLARIHESRGNWTGLIHLNEREAALVNDTKQVLLLHHRVAEIYDEQLKDGPSAIAAYEKVLALTPAYVPALRALGRLYAQDGRWEDLARMYRAEAEASPSTSHAAALLAKAGELYETRLNDVPRAIAAYHEVLTLEPSYVPALRALARIYRTQGAWESLVEVYRSEAANRTDPVERSNALYQAALIWEEQLGRPALAIQGYQDVLRHTPNHGAALRALERLYSGEGNVAEVIATLERQAQVTTHPDQKVIAYLKLARLYLDRQGEPLRAAQSCEAALALDPKNLLALATLERIRVQDRARRADLRARFAGEVDEAPLRRALDLASAMDQDALTQEDRLERYSGALATDPSDARVAFVLEQALLKNPDARGLAALYERAVATEATPQGLRQVLLRLGDVYEFRLRDAARAKDCYQRALKAAPGFLPALQGLRRVCLSLADFAGAKDALEAIGNLAKDPSTQVEALVLAGQLCMEHLGNKEGARANFRRALEIDALSPEANAGLEHLLATSGDPLALAELQEKRAGAKLAKRDYVAAAEGYVAAARSWLDQNNAPDKASAALSQALKALPTHPGALELLAELSLREHRYADAAAALVARLQQGGPAKDVARLHVTLGTLYQDHLSDADRAAVHLRTALADDPKNHDALERLASIYTEARNWTGAVDALSRLLELPLPAIELARHHVTLGHLHEDALGDAQRAVLLYRRALELAPEDADVLEALSRALGKLSRQGELVELLEAQAARAPDLQRAQAFRVNAAELCRSLGDLPRAIALYRQMTQAQPNFLTAHIALAELQIAAKAPLKEAVAAQLTVLRLDSTRAQNLHALFELYQDPPAPDARFLVAGLLVALGAANDAEQAFYADTRSKVPSDPRGRLSEEQFSRLLPAAARGPLRHVLREVGDQLGKLYPSRFEALGVDRRADKLKRDNPIHRHLSAVGEALGVEEVEVFLARKGLMTVVPGEPMAVCVGPDLARRFNLRELKFLMGRALMEVRNRSSLANRLARGELAKLLGNCVRIHHPGYKGLGAGTEDEVKQLRKALSRKVLKALEAPTQALATGPALELSDVQAMVVALSAAGDRTGLLFCADPAVAVGMMLRDEGAPSQVKDGTGNLALIRQRPEVQALIQFALSDEFALLRREVGPAVV
jgi:tetratricopeptide (TPR) repeat protein